jgi:glycosyltransferase involved in cell wall biosynthesis
MRFDRACATSIDLCVSELSCASRFAGETVVLAEAGADPLPAPTLVRLSPAAGRASAWRVLELVARLRRLQPDVVVVQQHIPTAAWLARLLPGVPVIAQTHNMPKGQRRKGLVGDLDRRRKARQLRDLAGITFVSEVAAERFAAHWPDIGIPTAVVPNGFDPSGWRPRQQRALEIVCIGRAAPEKGLTEAAYAVAAVLLARPDWKATFVVSEGAASPGETARIVAALKPLGNRASVRFDRPFSEIRELNERASIAVVPSRWIEPFGRTALEAHAGGAALVSSGTGGLREISGDCARYLAEVSVSSLAHTLDRLIADPAGRERMSQAAMQRVTALYTVSSVAERLDGFCARVRSLSLPKGVIAEAVRI